jgi:hypothetical protein
LKTQNKLSKADSTQSRTLYIAIIGDIVASRSLSGAGRRRIQTRFRQLTENLNQCFAGNLKAKFIVTLGDEFEGLLKESGVHEAIADILWTIEDSLPDISMRIGIGAGTIDTDIPEYAAGIDGPAIHRGRDAIEYAARNGQFGGVFRGFGANHDAILNGLARILQRQRAGWSRQQRKVAMLLRSGAKQTAVAQKMSLSKQAISAYARAAGWGGYREGENALRAALEEALNSKTFPR